MTQSLGQACEFYFIPGWQEFLGVSKQRAVTTEAVVYSEVRGLACITVSKLLPERGAERALIRPALQVATLNRSVEQLKLRAEAQVRRAAAGPSRCGGGLHD